MRDLIDFGNWGGLLLGEFQDAYGKECSIQESSDVSPHIWLGVNGEVGSRMHLTPDLVLALLPHLNRFAQTGSLRDDEGGTEFNDELKEELAKEPLFDARADDKMYLIGLLGDVMREVQEAISDYGAGVYADYEVNRNPTITCGVKGQETRRRIRAAMIDKLPCFKPLRDSIHIASRISTLGEED